MNPTTWRAMVDEVRILERTLGSADKFVTPNEKETVVLQRRCLRAARAIKAGETFTMDMVEALRPAVPGAVAPYELDDVVGKVSKVDMAFGQELRWHEIE
jgi:N-acetylneuraminate synthase